MAHSDQPTRPDPPARPDPSTRSGRHRARHHGAAPDPYPAPRLGDGWQGSDRPVFVRPGPDGGQRVAAEPADAPWADTPTAGAQRDDAGRAEDEPGDGQAAGPAPSAPKTGRAGRNLPAAIGVGLGLATVVLTALFYWRPAFLGVIVVAMGVGMWEMARAVRPGGARAPLAPLLAGGTVMAGLAWFAGPEALSLGLLLTVLATMVWRLADGAAGYQRDVTAATLIAVYVPFLGGFAALLAAPDDGHLRILVTLAAVVLSDTGGYAAGVFFGRHPMAPAVSPKKSWEGFAGSLVAAAVGSAVLLYLLFDVAPWWGALYGLALAVAAVLGDLAESMLKRDLQIKDMSQLLPGHGGLMDRLDSILFALPASYLLLSLLVSAAR